MRPSQTASTPLVSKWLQFRLYTRAEAGGQERNEDTGSDKPGLLQDVLNPARCVGPNEPEETRGSLMVHSEMDAWLRHLYDGP